MKGLCKKPLFKYLLIFSVTLIFISPIYMYFSHDVFLLKQQYPHLKVLAKKEMVVEIRPGRPKHWVDLKNISGYGKWAIVFSEDWSFYQHDGVDVEQMKAAFSDMMTAERFRGASTITQQMIKNVLLSDSRTVWRKIHELILAQKVENALSKDRILEIYFNSIEFGPGIYGIKNASQHYFKKAPGKLSAREGAFLAMLLPSPKRYYVSFEKKKLTKFAEIRIKAILKKLRMGKVLTPEQYEIEVVTKMQWEK